METLLIVAGHRNQNCRRSMVQSPQAPGRSGYSSINCRTFQSAAGILPTPVKASSPKTPKHLKKTVESSSVPILISFNAGSCDKEGVFSDEFPYSELWAGPAYSNSPPPSSLPIPKFSLRPKRTVSLPATPASEMDFDLNHPTAKSAPPSPTRDHSYSSARGIFRNADCATKTLRRILNLDITDV